MPSRLARLRPVSGAVLLLLLTAVPLLAAGHPLSVSYSRFVLADDALEARFRLPMDDMDLLLRLDRDLDGEVSEAELARAREPLQEYLAEHTRVTADGSDLTPRVQRLSSREDDSGFPYLQVHALYRAPAPIGDLAISVRVLTDLYPDHRNLAEMDLGADSGTEQFVFQHGNVWTGEREVAGTWQTVREFLLFGMEHIVTGYDHLLFLLGLLLVGRGLRSLVAIVTAFTVAHSLTLALAVLGLFNPVPWLVEALIALSIAYVGIENLVVREVRHRWVIAFAFGLVHGFGFAGLLHDMDLERGGLLLSLFTFNLGVEIGQVAIVALAWPLLNLVRNSAHRLLIVRVVSAIIVIFGLYWFVERVT